MRFPLLVGLIAVTALCFGSSDQLSPTAQENACRQISYILESKQHRTATQTKIASCLLDLEAWSEGRGKDPKLPKRQLDLTPRADGTVEVEIHATLSPSVLDRLSLFGFIVVRSIPSSEWVRGFLPVASLEAAASLPEVRTIVPPEQVATNSTTSEGYGWHRVGNVASYMGLTGKGHRVGVISDSVLNIEQSQASGELPNDVLVLPGQSGTDISGNSGEGTAMLEIVHDLAPGASLAFASGFAGSATMAQNIRDLHAAGCDIIVDDLTYFRAPVFQDDSISNAVNEVTAKGALYFSCMANGGNKLMGTASAWHGLFSDGGAYGSGSARAHNWGGTTTNKTGESRALVLQWNDPFGHSSNDYDLFVVDSAGNVLKSSTGTQSGGQDPLESLSNPGGYVIAIKYSGLTRILHLDNYRSRLTKSTEYGVRGHNGCAGAISIGAATNPMTNGAFTKTSPIEDFTTDGPRRLYYDPAGNQLTPGNLGITGGQKLLKPEFTAADGVKTSVPGFTKFFGTSAAAPHAAAIAALLKELDPTLNRVGMVGVMRLGAIDPGGIGWNPTTGYGIIDAMSCSAQYWMNTTSIAPTSGYAGGKIPVTLNFAFSVPTNTIFSISYDALGTQGAVAVDLPAGQKSVTVEIPTPESDVDYEIPVSARLYGPTDIFQVSGTVYASATPCHIQSITSSPASVGDKTKVTFTVSLDRPAPSGGVSVDLESTFPSVLTVPITVAVSEGETVATFTGFSHANPLLTGSTITASLFGRQVSTAVEVHPSKLLAVPFERSQIAGGQSIQGAVQLDGAAPAGGYTALLSVPVGGAYATVPAQVTVPAGLRSIPFTIRTSVPSTLVIARIAARNAKLTVSNALKVLPPSVIALSLSPDTVTGSTATTALLSLSNIAPAGGVTVKLTSSSSLYAQVPVTVSIPEGSDQVEFVVQTSATPKARTVTISAQVLGTTRLGTPLKITP